MLAFGGGVAYIGSRSGGSGRHYVFDTTHAGSGTAGFDVNLDGRPIAGKRDAPVDIYYWTDYLCPFCKQFETETLPELGREHLDTGGARLAVLRHCPRAGWVVPVDVLVDNAVVYAQLPTRWQSQLGQ